MKFYLVAKNNVTCEMSVAAIFESFADALNVSRLLNNQRVEKNDNVHRYGVTNNPMVWQENN